MSARILTEQTRRVKSERRAWAAEVVVDVRGDMSREDFGGLCNIGESRVRACETQDEGKTEQPRMQLDKLAGLTEDQRAAFCRALMGPGFVVAKVDGEDVADAAAMLREANDAVLAKMAEPRERDALLSLAKEAGEAKAVFAVVEARALRDAAAITPSKPLRSVGTRS